MGQSVGCSAEQCNCSRSEDDRFDRVEAGPLPSGYATAGLGNKENVAPTQAGSSKVDSKDRQDLRLPVVSATPVQQASTSSKAVAASPAKSVAVERLSEAAANSLTTISLSSTASPHSTLENAEDDANKLSMVDDKKVVPGMGKHLTVGLSGVDFEGMEPTWTAHYSQAGSSDGEEFVPAGTATPDMTNKQTDKQVEFRVFLNAHNFDATDLNRPNTCSKPVLPLHAAISQGKLDIVEMLLQAKADPTKKISSDSSWQLARKLPSEEAAKVLALLGEDPVDSTEKKGGVFRRFSGGATKRKA